MKIGIIGKGIVGSALYNYFKENTDHNLFCYDPPKDILESISACEAIFICVPVQTKGDGFLDYTILDKSILRCPTSSKIFVKSTVLPGTCDLLSEKYHANIYSCPEFLTERKADADMKKLPVIVGYDNIDYMKHIFPNKRILIMKNKECELAKYAHNCFGAMKVTFFNAIYEQCEKLKINYDNVLRGTLNTGYINKTHTQVPGPDKLFGYGGKCFTKDVKAFNSYLNMRSYVIHGTQLDNYKYRNKRMKDLRTQYEKQLCNKKS